jgi:hypothetical protein
MARFVLVGRTFISTEVFHDRAQPARMRQAKTLPISPVQTRIVSRVPLTGVKSAPVGVWMMAPSFDFKLVAHHLGVHGLPSRRL